MPLGSIHYILHRAYAFFLVYVPSLKPIEECIYVKKKEKNINTWQISTVVLPFKIVASAPSVFLFFSKLS